MRFLGRALLGLFLTAATIGLLAMAVYTTYDAVQARNEGGNGGPPGRERVFAAEVAPIELGRETPVLTAFGEIRSRRTLELRAPAEGTVIFVADGFEDGGAVAAGDLLARIDPAEAQSARDTAAADLRDAENELAEAQRALDLAIEELEAARMQAELRTRALERAQDLADRGVGSAAAVETAELAEATADQQILAQRRALAQAEARVDNAGTALERRRIALAEADRRLAQTELRAAFDGVLTEVDIAEGRLVNRNERFAALIDADALEVAFRISTAQYVRLLDENGQLTQQPVRVLLDVFGLDLVTEGVITRESGAVEEGQTGRLLFAQIDVPRGLRVGDFVRVEVDEPQLPRVARLPATSLGSDGRILVLGDGNVLESIAVELLRRQGDDVLVQGEGLRGRDVVLVRTPVLGDGIRVNPIRSGAADAAPEEPQTIALEPDRRARLIAFVEGNSFIPPDVRERMLNQLSEDEVPSRMVARLEARMGS